MPDATTRPTGELTVRSRAQASTLEVVVAGNLDMAAAFPFETRLDGLMAAADVQAVQVNLAQVDFVDSAGLGALLAIRERAKQLGIDLAITHVSDPVGRILELTGLAEIADD